ncbi:hypothetical protein [Lentzea flaviverrucosa]|uniref:DUF2178 domain-containing protein n=1 Tax=Lentzea flaviverrucosa TaxID=200379 RepID=A0A1H9VJB9_9PSEU|nr:hypothetical protein [Lentzea flaviverrucosa]RDI23818.1 hypothetical protein DFR72_110224 [Lentzea flaviverrucosa]SES21702.1 hypothetical protein SAMN05216195_110112 [Lentzea flaviverrucosa]
MAFEEKRAWALAIIAIAGYAVYVVLVLNGMAGRPLAEAPYVGALLWTILGGIVAGIVSGIWLGIAARDDGLQADERDQEIGRFGDHIGQSFIAIGGVSAMALAMLEAPYFWIANVLYLCFVLSAVLGSLAKIAFYRQGMP